MSAVTSIEWTDRSWNPVRGCSRVSEGCRHCYAERVAARFSGPGKPYEGLATAKGWTGKLALVEKVLAEPLRWRKPQRVFVNSMSDLFHESLPDEAIDRVFAVMALAPQHTFQVLTKRAERMREYVAGLSQRHTPDGNMNLSPQTVLGTTGLSIFGAPAVAIGFAPWPLPNVWLGVSVEDQQRLDERLPYLLATPAAVRFLSVEPLLGPIRIADAGRRPGPTNRLKWGPLDWVIVGGESGPGARPCDLAWIRSVVEQCRAAGVPVFCKQLGARPTETTEAVARYPLRLRDRKGGDPTEWPEDIRVREFPEVGR